MNEILLAQQLPIPHITLIPGNLRHPVSVGIMDNASQPDLAGKYIFKKQYMLTLQSMRRYLEVNKTKSKNSPTLKNSQKFIRWGQWFNTRSISEKVINFEITDFSMYGDFLPKIDASFL